MKNYQNKITINDEEYYVRTEPVIINAGDNAAISVYTSYLDPLHDIAKVSPTDLKNAFENGIPVYYNYDNRKASISELIVTARYHYNGEDLEEMELMNFDGITRLWVYFYEEPIGPGPEAA
jgi:hypothetical protein